MIKELARLVFKKLEAYCGSTSTPNIGQAPSQASVGVLETKGPHACKPLQVPLALASIGDLLSYLTLTFCDREYIAIARQVLPSVHFKG